ncbi:MAG: S1-C subfamily serine protease [Bacteroidia bacterium]|jgi:S1-C subfamily serine protease
MFAKSYEIASIYTQPVLVSLRLFNGKIESGLGSFVIINDEGWVITAAHILDSLAAYNLKAKEIKAYHSQLAEIENDPNLDAKAKSKRKRKLVSDPTWVTNSSHWWGHDSHKINNFHVLKENDIAIGKIENYNPNFCSLYPVFKDPKKLKIGTSLCKLGYPFNDVKASFSESNNTFAFDPSIFPIPRFPLDGIFTRNILAGKSADNKFDIKFIETSSPGLRGQSGGPIFDVDGNIWAIQSQTRHLPLGFSPKIKKGNHEIEENQFLNVGWGAHVETILNFLDAHHIKYSKT